MKAIFIGTVQLSYVLLETLIQKDVEIIGVITSKNNKFNSDYADLSGVCKKNKIPILYTKNINSDKVTKWIKNKSPDIMFCFGWSQIIRDKVLKIPKEGVIGYHPAMLPKNRGRHPLIWALANGQNSTGSTFFKMNSGTDTGDIVSQKKIKIYKYDDASSLYKKMQKLAKVQISTIINKINTNKLTQRKQKNKNSNYLRKRNIADGKIDWRMRATDIHNLIRALTRPYVGAHFTINEKIFKVWKSKILNKKIGLYNEPGKVLSVKNNKVTIQCNHSIIKLIEINPKPNLKKGDYL